MEKEKVVFFLDYANVNRAAREKRYRMDYADLLHYVGEQRFLVEAYCYVPINPRNEHRLDAEIEELWRAGYIVTTKMGTIAGGTYKCNFDVEIAMDVQRVVYQVKPDIIVLATGDSDFIPLIQEVRRAGVRVEVATFLENAGTDILIKSSGFINLAVYYDGYLAALDGNASADRLEDDQFQKLIESQALDLDADEPGAKITVDLKGEETGVAVADSSDDVTL
ncbi:MAG TPA: NYN domain-containing protein [Ktedonobacteraceae bacterium]|nr:NYN domain-containing protein [Ktedonobacteraceae bacterium]